MNSQTFTQESAQNEIQDDEIYDMNSQTFTQTSAQNEIQDEIYDDNVDDVQEVIFFLNKL